MTKKFKGTINVDIRDSVQDWDAFTQPNPRGAPNVVILLWDDTGIGTETTQRVGSCLIGHGNAQDPFFDGKIFAHATHGKP